MNIPLRRGKYSKNGSALLVTLLVISLLLIMVVAFTTFVRMSLREVTNHQQLLTARANARLGAEMAVASLQELLGPDQRVTARGELFDGSVPNVTGIQLNTDRRRLVGVWDSTAYNETNPAAHANGFLGWLISSGDPAARIGLQDALPAPGQADTLTLLGEASVANAEDHIHARLVDWSQGGYAWMVDDNGLKAQLTASVRNDESPDRPPGGGVLPGAYPPDRLQGMGSLSGVDLNVFQRLISLRELHFVTSGDTPPQIAREKYFDFTPSSIGVLSNTRDGGLKKDLTIAFENNTVFSRVFPTGDQNRYLAIPPEKLAQAADLRQNGYIHWNIFRDFYNIKRHINRVDGHDVLDMHRIAKDNLLSQNNNYRRGTLAPHAMGVNTNPQWHRQLPYGDVEVFGYDRNNPSPYKHNYIGVVLSMFQQNAWLDYDDENSRLTTHVQIWASKYNPYNIGVLMRGNASTEGPRLINYPDVHFHIPGVSHNFSSTPGVPGLGGNPQMNPEHKTILSPGKSQVYGFENTVRRGQEENRGAYGASIQNLLTDHVFFHHDNVTGIPPSPQEFDVEVTFRNHRANILHGVDMHPAAHGDLEITQVIYAPFAWDVEGGHPAKKIRKRVTADELNMNTMFSFGFHLRTTRESDSSSIRPLVDGNIRALYNNPRWDSPLDFSTLAIYSTENRGELSEMIPQMTNNEHPKGFSYWGRSRRATGSDRVILFDIPREDLVSLGQLQHASAGRFSYEPSYIVANSYANPRIPLSAWRDSISDTFSSSHNLETNLRISGRFNLYDASYLVNQRIWDEYTFTTIPHVRDNHTPGEPPINFVWLRTGEIPLANPRFIPHIPNGSEFTRPVLQDTGNTQGTRGSFFHNAGHVLVDGAFNVNSTSVDAWEAFLTGTLELPVQAVNNLGIITGYRSVSQNRVRFPRVKAVYGEGMDSDSLNDNFWTGFRELTQNEVREIAEAVVEQVKLRGPFLNMGQFVNRMLENNELGESGPLQAALDATVNQNIPNTIALEADGIYGDTNQGTGFPGQLLQGDILQALGPLMQVRSNTFTIRAYGETQRVQGQAPSARAWCEMVVQRVPEPVVNNPGAMSGADFRAEMADPGSPFGRQFRIVSFRWLNEDEI